MRPHRWRCFHFSALLAVATCAAACQPRGKPAPAPQLGAPGSLSGDVARNTDRAREETDRAYTLIQDGKYTDAEPALKRALVADPMYGAARNDLGIVYYHLNRLYEAAWEFQNAAKLMPRQGQPQNNLGLVMDRAGRTDDALRAYDKAVELEPDNSEYAGNLARARIRTGLRDEVTRRLLEVVVARDARPEWVDWARFNLTRLRPSPSTLEGSPTTEP
ncbi:MAG TPA: tetratricopeptide repeat protein [Tepidisphaeraceae bacterium]|nr:tetratricopeptide repeat protein [Tepidisphaeraceae bacterium]